ncbi:MAG: hypothetical protein RL662_1024 [Bacteroidota bacterium]|jgi:hypothetical protein
MDRKLWVLIDSLGHRTKKREVNWTKQVTEEGTIFVLSLNVSDIYVNKKYSSDQIVNYRFWIVSPEGDMLISLDREQPKIDEDSKEFELLRNLIEEVHIGYFGIDAIVDDLLNQTKQDGVIGKSDGLLPRGTSSYR